MDEIPSFSINFNSQVEPQTKRVCRLTDEELTSAIEDQKSQNTERTTKFALRTWQA